MRKVYFGKNSPIKIPLSPARQKYDWDCGPSSLRSIFKSYDGHNDHDYCIDACNTRKHYGTTVNGIINASVEEGYKVKLFYDMTINQLRKEIEKIRPVICVISAWETSHYVTAIGYDKNNFYFVDPFLWNSIGYLPIEELKDRWISQAWNGKFYNRTGISIWKPNSKIISNWRSKPIKFIPQ